MLLLFFRGHDDGGGPGQQDAVWYTGLVCLRPLYDGTAGVGPLLLGYSGLREIDG